MHRNEWTMFYDVKRIKSNVNKYKLKYISILSVADASYSTNVSWAVNLISTFLSIQIQSIDLKLNMKGINNVQRYTSMQILNECLHWIIIKVPVICKPNLRKIRYRLHLSLFSCLAINYLCSNIEAYHT
jgi:hypothetical protein